MKNVLLMSLFFLAMLAWVSAQQTGRAAERNSGQSASPSSQAPGATQTQPSKPGGADQSGARGQESQAPVTEGCLGGSDPNYTITDNNGTVYKLNMPANADTSKLPSHLGESVKVLGDVKGAGKPGNASIDVQGMGRGTGNCPASGPKSTPPPSKQ